MDIGKRITELELKIKALDVRVERLSMMTLIMDTMKHGGSISALADSLEGLKISLEGFHADKEN